MKGAAFLGALLLGPPAGRAAFEEKSVSAAAESLGESVVGDAFSPDAWLTNPAALSFLDRGRAQLSHAQWLGSSALPFTAAAAAAPSGRGGWGAWATGFGDAVYREWEAGVAHAILLSPSLSVGAAAALYDMRVARYGGGSSVGVDAGLLARPLPRVSWGISVRRLNHPGLPGAREGLPPLTRLGFSWALGRAARIDGGLAKPGDRPFCGRLGLEAALAPGFLLRLGGETRPARYGLGFGIGASFGRIDYAFLDHPFLGDQHQVSLSVPWGHTRRSP